MKKLALCNSLVIAILFILLNPARPQSYTKAQPYSDPKLLQDFLCSEVVYPGIALEKGVEGKVIIGFGVAVDGKISNVKIAQSVSPEVDAEALRLFRMLLWEPALQMGQPVASENTYIIDFSIKKYNKHCKQRGYVRTEYPYQPVDSTYAVYEITEVEKKPFPVFDEPGMTLSRFIAKNIKYPETAYKQNLSGKVSLRFVVEINGRPSNIKVIAPVGGGCTQEAIRLLQMVKWMPGIKNKYAVRTFMNLDIEFVLPENSNMNMFENVQMNSN